MRQYIAVVIALLSIIHIHAQVVVSGKVMSANGSTLPYAIVQVFENDSTFVKGCEVNNTGDFKLELDSIGKYKFIYSSLGCKIKNITADLVSTNTDLGTICLETDMKIMQEIIVNGRRIDRTDNHLEIYPDLTSVKHSFSAYQLLDNLKLPGFEVQSMTGSVELFGKDVSLYIDGMPADYNAVKNLRSKDIAKVEYHDVPTGRYSNDYAAINFITKKYPLGGYATIDAQQNIGHVNGTYEAYAKLSKGDTQISVSGGYSMWDMTRDKQYRIESYIFSDKIITRDDRSLKGRTKRDSEYGQFKVMNSNQQRSMSGNISLVHTNTSKNRNSELVYSSPVDIFEKSFSLAKENTLSPSAAFYGYFNLPKQFYLVSNIMGKYTHNSNQNFYTVNKSDLFTGANENYYQANGIIKLGKNFKHHNSLSFTIAEYYDVSSTNYTGSYTNWIHFWASHTMLTLDYRHQLSKFQFYVRPGLSLNYNQVHREKQYGIIQPNFYTEVIYRPSNIHQLRGTANILNGTLPPQLLTSVEQQQNFLFAMRGNPDMKRVMLIQNYELTYSSQLNKVNLAARFAYDKNHNYPVPFYYSEKDMIIQSFRNGDASIVYIDPSITYSVVKWLRFNLTGKYRHYNLDGTIDFTLNHFSARLSTSFYWKDFALNIDLSSPVKSMNFNTTDMLAVTKSPATYSFNLSWNHKNWSASGWITNPFSRVKTHITLFTDAYNYHTLRISPISGFLKLCYTFDFGKKIKRNGVDRVDTSTGSGILK